MRTCKPPLDGDSGNQSTAGSCFASVGTAAHSYHGDDAVGYGPGYMVVADGVSGTMKASGVLARLLVSETLCSLNKLRKRAREEPMKPADLTTAIQSAAKTARRATKRKGRLDSTLTVVYFDEASHQMFVYTIGDCKCVLMRNSKIVFESDSIIYDFNVPAVVSNNKTINYTGEVHIQTCKYEAGDVCMVFSDGVHDNLYVDQVVACVEPCPENAEEIAKKTVQMAKNTFTDCDDYIPFAVSAAGFCREAMAELKTNSSVNLEEYEAFSQKCQNIPAFEITRPMFAKENRVRQLAFYSASNLLAFAHKRQGKRDDVSVCAAVLAYQLAFGSQTPPSRKSNKQERPARAVPAKATRAIMGKRGRKDFRNKSGNFNKKSRQARDDIADAATGGWVDKREDGFSEWVYTNDNFIKYYQAQGVVPEAEWDTFMKFLATPLPTTFRINNSCPFAENIRERIANDFKFDGLVLDDEQIAPIANMPWYPNQKGFQWSVERRKVRKLPILAEFQKWLVELTNSGSTTRQEAVSMIPPLILGVEPHHKVLDMCAAPGSKTSQLLESLHAQEHITGETPTGMVMANDIDLKRAYMLVHQSKRIGSPALLVTCHEAQHIPYVGAPELKSEGFFDRILCDAPCSGDGTLRKNPIIWKQWDAKNGIALHPLQVEISKRGASLLKVGGYMCYSTCTFNPLENEAIVAELLRWSNGALELVDVADRLPLLKRRPGISSWKVMGSGQIEYNSFEHYVAENEKQRGKNKITPTMFPPTAEEAAAFNLDRCMRCVPHDENTGGFFICLFKKTAPTPQEEEPEKRAGKKHRTPTEPKEEGVKTEEEETAEVKTEEETTEVRAEEEEEVVAEVEPKDEAATATAAAAVPAASTDTRGPRLNRQERRQLKQKGEEYVALDDAQWKSIQEHFGIVAPFSGAQLFTRSDESKSVTFVTKSITSELIEEMKAKKLKVVYTGLKLFERTESSGSTVYRLCQAGLPHVLPFISKRKITVSKREFQMMLERLGDLMDYDEFEPATQKIFEDAPLGSISCSMENPRSLVEEKIMNIVVWRGRNSVNVMATKADAVVLLSAMKELKLFDAQVSEAVQLAKQKRDAERAQRDLPEAKTVEAETVAVAEEKEEATATPVEE